MQKKKETKQTSVPNKIGGVSRVSYEAQTSTSSYCSRTISSQRIVETKTYSSTISLPSKIPFEDKGSNEERRFSFPIKSSSPSSISDNDTRPSPRTTISQSSSLQRRYSPVYSSLPSNTRPILEPAVYSRTALSSPLTKSSTTKATPENERPDEKRLSLLPSSQPRSIFDLDARPCAPSASLPVRPSGYQGISRNADLPITPLATRTTNDFSQNRDLTVPTYDTNGKKRGKALIINNVKFMKKKDERTGAEFDQKRISDLFKKIGFDVKEYKDLKKSEMNDKINKYKSDRSLEKVDISVIIIMSHGHNKQDGIIVRGGYTEIDGIDGQSLPIDDVLSKFDSENCSALRGKPKIFIFQCCRGKQREELHADAAPIENVIKQHADMLIAFSTIPGFYSIRDPVRGSWYIQSICDVFERHAKAYDVESMLKIVDEELSKKHPEYQQTSSYESRGFKRCFLNPQS